MLNTAYSPNIEYYKPQGFEFIESVQKLDMHNISCIEAILARQDSKDSYSKSPGYYAFTGRKGLWIYREKQTAIIFCLHPNIDNTILIFPLLGKRDVAVLDGFIRKLKPFGKKIELSRVPQEDLIASNYIKYGEEEVLDWKYPIYTYSTSELLKMEGRPYRQFRNYVKRAYKDKIVVRTCDIVEGFDKVKTYLDSVSLNAQRNEDEWDTSNEFFTQALYSSQLDLSLVIAEKEGKVIGAAIIEKPIPGRVTANVLMVQADKGYQGLFEYMYYGIAAHLERLGVYYYCDGGSEYEGLDKFKRKMQPCKEIQLMTGFVKERLYD